MVGGEEEAGWGKPTPVSRTAGKCVEQPLEPKLGGEAAGDASSGPREDDVGRDPETMSREVPHHKGGIPGQGPCPVG